MEAEAGIFSQRKVARRRRAREESGDEYGSKIHRILMKMSINYAIIIIII